jgi:hypothetical protein
MPDARSNAEPVAIDGKPPECLNAVDVNEMGRARQSECHDRNETLATCQDASVERRDFSQKADRFVDGLRCMVSEGSNLHLGPVSAVAASIDPAMRRLSIRRFRSPLRRQFE